MARVNRIDSVGNIVFEYELPWTNNKSSVINWLEQVASDNRISVREIMLDNLADRSDENQQSVVLAKIVGEYNLYRECNERGIDIVSIVAKYKGAPIIIGSDFRTNKLFITVRKSKQVDYEEVEKIFGLA